MDNPAGWIGSSSRAARRTGVALVLCFLLSAAIAPRAHALDRDKRNLITSGLYGMAGGALMGLVATPSTRSGKSIFIGTSIGLYLGLVVGLYHVSHRDDPSNPLYTPGPPALAPEPSRSAPWLTAAPADLELSFSVARF